MIGDSFFLIGLAISLIVGTSSAGEAVAADIRVPSEYPAIQMAVDTARRGDRVLVAAGIYYENVTMKEGVVLEGGWSKDFSRRDLAASITAIDGGKKGGWVVSGANDAVLDGFTIINGRPRDAGDSPVGSGVHCQSTSPLIINNVIKENKPAGIYCNNSSAVIKDNIVSFNEDAGIYVEKGSVVTIKGNTIKNNKMAGIGTGTEPVSRIEIGNNIIHDNEMAGIDARSATGTIYNNIIYQNKKAGIRSIATPLEIRNNTIVANQQAGIMEEDPLAFAAVKNNIITHNGDAGIRGTGRGYSYNLLFANNMTDDCNPDYLWCVRRQFGGYEDEQSFGQQGNIIADPWYLSAGRHDYRLLPGSPAIDAGDPHPQDNNDNFAPSLGTSRNDMGAYGGPTAIPGERNTHDPPEASLPRQIYTGNRDTTIITAITDHPPTAKISGISDKVLPGEVVTLFGSASRDPERHSLTYRWELFARPLESRAAFNDNTLGNPSFPADSPGCYAARLIVNDGRQDSLPDTLYLCTSNHNPDGKRKVPEEYPTIQAAIDAADPGDEIVVGPGIYRENLIIDKRVDLLGIDWPVIDGGTREGNIDTLLIFHLGEEAGMVRGFVITGGGKGALGHGVKIWNSSPEICNNKIMKNGHVGLGIHGRQGLTAKTRIHDNFICENLVGIGNGKGGSGQIYNNSIHDNQVVGIGARGFATPRIFGNNIFGNHVGVGLREQAFLHVEGNRIHDNVFGIAISPITPAEPSGEEEIEFDDSLAITIDNNQIRDNLQNGVFISSFNISDVTIANNSIIANNHWYAKERRGAGILYGYPWPARFAAVMKQNVIAGNKVNDLVNYTGSELFPASGALIIATPPNVAGSGRTFLADPLPVPPIFPAPALDLTMWLSNRPQGERMRVE